MHLIQPEKGLPQAISETFNQSLLALEVDLVVLSKEHTKLGSFLERITEQLRVLRQLGQEQDLVQEPQDLI